MRDKRDPALDEAVRLNRRTFLTGIGVSAVALVGLTSGQTFDVLAPLNAFAPRRIAEGPQGLPINRTAAQARVVDAATDAGWQLSVRNGDTVREFSRSALAALPQVEAELPIACVEGWSTSARWRGVPLRDLIRAVHPGPAPAVRITSLQPHGTYRVSEMGAEYVDDPMTLVALELNGETLHLEHGYPARIMAPGRPGVLQTKWLSSIEVMV
jgi:DMSO/TMAO reductase YedYZ molybdopterin-dependent catalytic subunit